MSSITSRLLRSARSKSGGVQKLSVSYTVVVHALVLPATAGDTCSVTLERGPKTKPVASAEAPAAKRDGALRASWEGGGGARLSLTATLYRDAKTSRLDSKKARLNKIEPREQVFSF